MASACLNRIGISPDNLLDSYGWFSPRLSISREEDASKSKNRSDLSRLEDPVKELSDLELNPTEFDGFEFRLDDPVIMLPADELFSDGKLVPLHLSVIRQESATLSTTTVSGDTPYTRRRSTDADPYLFSPRAPRCSSRWKELLGFSKLYQTSNNNNNIAAKVDKNNNNNKACHKATGSGATRSIRQFLHRSPKPSNDSSSINLPLLDNESVSVSSRPSLSSSSDDLTRLSLDNMNINPNNRPETRKVKMKPITKTQSTTSRVGRSSVRRSADAAAGNRGLTVDSPRMSSSGKIVFHSLERSSSSPSSFNGGPRLKHRGMERSNSANVRITPVLNVPVCSLSKSGSMFGFPIFSLQQKREGCSSSNNGGGSGSNRSQRFN